MKKLCTKTLEEKYETPTAIGVQTAVLGSGTIGLLATLVLRLRGFEVVTFGKKPAPYLNSELIEEIGASYVSTGDLSVHDFAASNGRFDLIFECTGFSPIVFDAMQALEKNGVLVLSSVTGSDRTVEIPADKINLEFVLGNKVMVGTVNANRDYFESGVKDMAQSVLQFGNWLSKLLTHRVSGLENFDGLFTPLIEGRNVIKVYCEI